MEQRTAKINISSAGGTAGQDSKTYKVTLPAAWLETMGITREQRDLVLRFDGTSITLSRPVSGPDFAVRQRSLGHDVRILRLYDGKELCSSIYADLTSQLIVAENHVVSPVKTAFGNNALPDWGDFQSFLSSRCIPRQRAGLREYLEVLGLEEYDPFAIIEKTGGRMAEDQQWLTIEVVK